VRAPGSGWEPRSLCWPAGGARAHQRTGLAICGLAEFFHIGAGCARSGAIAQADVTDRRHEDARDAGSSWLICAVDLGLAFSIERALKNEHSGMEGGADRVLGFTGRDQREMWRGPVVLFTAQVSNILWVSLSGRRASGAQTLPRE